MLDFSEGSMMLVRVLDRELGILGRFFGCVIWLRGFERVIVYGFLFFIVLILKNIVWVRRVLRVFLVFLF